MIGFTMQRTPRPKPPASFLLKLLLPFVGPMGLTFALLILAGEHWPRDIAPGSGLKFAGLCASALTALAIWHLATRGFADLNLRRFAAIVCAVTGLMGWPVWTTGVLPSVNGMVLGNPVTVPMTFERTERTQQSRSRNHYHWVWLKTQSASSPIGSGRYFISEGVYDALTARRPVTVRVTVAHGLLWAQVVQGFEPHP